MSIDKEGNIINFGEINQFMLFGGGQLLSFMVSYLKQANLPLLVVIGERNISEKVSIGSQLMPLEEYLKFQQINYIISKNVSTDDSVIKHISKSTMGISSGAPWIFKEKFIDRFNGKLLNLHGARLPQDRGGGGFSWRILRGDRVGVSLIHQIDPGVDTGDIIMSNEYTFPSSCRLPFEYKSYSIEQYQKLIRQFFRIIEAEESFVTSPQQEYFSSYWPRLSTNTHGYIDWSWSLTDIEKFICAFDDPYDGAATFINGEKVRVKKCYSWTNDGLFHPFQQGIIYRANENTVFIATQQGSLLVNSISDETGRNIRNDLHVGDRLYTPNCYLEEAKEYRAIYTSKGLKKT